MTQDCINSNNPLIQYKIATIATLVTCSTVIAADDSIPQNTEGDEVITLAITPRSSTSKLEITFSGIVSKDTNSGTIQVALFQDSTAGALAARSYKVTASTAIEGYLRHLMTSGTTSSTTFKIRIGPGANNIYVNGNPSGTVLMGGVSSTTLTIKEYV